MPSAVRNAVRQTDRGLRSADQHPGLATHAAAGLLAFAAVVAPLAMGCTGEWGRLGLEAVMTVAVTLWAVSWRERPRTLVLPAAIAAVVLLQLLPLPDGFLVNVAPVSAGSWKVAHEGQPTAWGTISINPAATAAGGRRLLLGLATITAVAGLSRLQSHRRWLMGAISLSALIILVLGFLFPFDREDRTLLGFIDLKGPIEFWRTPVLPPAQTSGWAYLEWVTLDDRQYLADLRVIGDGFGPYVTSNQFAAGVYLTLPVCLGMLLVLCRDRGRISTAASRAATVVAFVAAMWIVGHMAASRAGAAALLLAGLALAALVSPRGWLRRSTSFAALAYAAFIVLFAMLFLGNFQTLSDVLPEQWRARILVTGDDGRAIASRTAVRMFLASPLLGTGFGTFGDLYPRLTGGRFVWYFAHNDYAQLLAETGLAGLAVAVALISMMAVCFRKFIRLPELPTKVLDAGPWASLAAVLAHSLFDWNLHVPANAYLASLIAGLCISSVPISPAGVALPAGRGGWLTAIVPKAILVGACLLAFAVLVRDAWSDSRERNLRLALALNHRPPSAAREAARPAAPSLTAAVAAAERAAAWDSGNAGLALAVGQAILHESAPQGGDVWFRKAQARRAVCRGIPQPVPPTPRSLPNAK
jgi:O-antigen ligase